MGPASILAVQWGSALAAAAAGAVPLVLRVRRREPLRALDVALSGGVVACAALASMLVLSRFGLGPFGWIRVAYTTAVVVVPLLAVAIVAARRARGVPLSRGAWALTLLGLVPAPLGAWATYVEPRRLEVVESVLDLAPQRTGDEPVRIAILADLQCNEVGDHEREAVDLLLAQRPDVILVPGDVFHGWQPEWDASKDALRELMARLDAPGGVFFVFGDTDTPATVELLRTTRVRVVENEIVRTRVRGRDLTIGGIAFRRGDGGLVRRLESLPGEGDVRIVLCHKPDHALRLAPSSRIDLVVAGHTHGGQIVVPGFGPPMTLSSVPRHIAAGGLHLHDGNAIYVSRGVGMERTEAPPMRLFCRPEVSVVTLRGGSGRSE